MFEADPWLVNLPTRTNVDQGIKEHTKKDTEA